MTACTSGEAASNIISRASNPFIFLINFWDRKMLGHQLPLDECTDELWNAKANCRHAWCSIE
jgi:hypothetical protein